MKARWFFACLAWLLTADSTPAEIPNGWDLVAIAKATPPFGVEGDVQVLAWKKFLTGHGPFEQCLVLKVAADDRTYGRWCLAHLQRQPDKDHRWRTAKTHVSGKKGSDAYPGKWIFHSVNFKRSPGNAEVYPACDKLADGVYWKFDRDGRDTGFEAAVCAQTWKSVIGADPTRWFAKPPEVEKK